MDEFAKALLAEGNTTVATLLVRRYRELGMTNDEFLVYLQLKSFADQASPSLKLRTWQPLSVNQNNRYLICYTK